MSYLAAIRLRVERVLQSYRFRYGVFSLLFGVGIVGIYYLIAWLIPRDYLMHSQLVTILFIVTAVVVLFPARQQALQYLLGNRESTAFLGVETHHLDVIARQFSVSTLVEEIFPDLMDWLGVRSARLAVLNPNRRLYDSYAYRRGQAHPVRAGRDDWIAEAARTLRGFRRTLHIHEAGLSPAGRELFRQSGAVLIQPLIYRRRLSGFLLLNETPRQRTAERALEFFANKAAVSIQNNILTNRVIDSRIYDRELSAARRIQSSLHNAPLPEIPGLTLHRHDHPASILEFIHGREPGVFYLVGLCLDRLTSPGGIALSTMLGYLYSFTARERNFTLQRILGQLRKYRSQLSGTHSVAIFAAEIRSKQASVILQPEDPDHELLLSNRGGEIRREAIAAGARKFIKLREVE